MFCEIDEDCIANEENDYDICEKCLEYNNAYGQLNKIIGFFENLPENKPDYDDLIVQLESTKGELVTKWDSFLEKELGENG